MAPMVQNPPALQEMCVLSLGWADPLEKGMATHYVEYSVLENSINRRVSWAIVHGVTVSQT